MEQAYTQGRPIACFQDWEELNGFIQAQVPGPWVAKGEFGNAGLANWHFEGPPVGIEDETVLRRILTQTGALVVEPRHNRVRDFGVTFNLSSQGEVDGFGLHELLNNSLGVFIGAALGPELGLSDKEVEELRQGAEFAARALHAEGYFGPVNLDAYEYREGDKVAMRSLVDTNARQSMTLPARNLARHLPGRYIRWEWRASKRLKLPLDYQDLTERLGPLGFTSEKGTGILAASPLWMEKDGVRKTPKRIGLAFISESGKGVEEFRSGFDGLFKLHRGKPSNS